MPVQGSLADSFRKATVADGKYEESVRVGVQKMRARQIKQELDRLGVSAVGAIEKEDLVERLVAARLNKPVATTAQPPPSPPAPPPAPPVEVVGSGGAAGTPFGDMSAEEAQAFEEAAKQLGVDQGDAMKMAQAMFDNPSALSLMMEIQSKPKVQEAMMEMATGGEAAALKYMNDPEVAEYMRRLEKLGLDAGFPGMS